MTGRARLLEIAAAEVAANAHPPSAGQNALVQSQLAPTVNAAAASKNDAAGDAAA